MIIFKSISNLERQKILIFFETYDMICHHPWVQGIMYVIMGSAKIRPVSAPLQLEVENP